MQRASDTPGDECDHRNGGLHGETGHDQTAGPVVLLIFDAFLKQNIQFSVSDPPEFEAGVPGLVACSRIILRRQIYLVRVEQLGGQINEPLGGN